MANSEDTLREDEGALHNSYNNDKSHADTVLDMYRALREKMQDHFPKVDQHLLFDIIRYQTAYQDWDGNAILKLVYKDKDTDLESKKNWVFNNFNRVPSAEEDRTLRFKGIRIDLQTIEQIVQADKDIEFITGSATLSPSSDSYSA
jgi:hypothetical protein